MMSLFRKQNTVCPPSFARRLVSFFCAFSMLLSSVSGAAAPVRAAAESRLAVSVQTDPLPQPAEPELSYQSFELYPNGEDSGELISLDGLMPEGAAAEAVDVSEEHEALAAYDITIVNGDEEYQPGSENPIFVEITDPDIPETGSIELWHIRDDGEREQIEEFTFSDGTISFYAEGFSVYEIIDCPVSGPSDEFESVTSVAELDDDNEGFGFYWYYGSGTYVTAELNGNSAFKETSSVSGASVWHFEESGGSYKIYTYIGDTKKYIHNTSGNLVELNTTNADLFDIDYAVRGESFYFKKNGENKWLQHSNGGNGIRYYTDNKNANNSSMKLYKAPHINLDGKTYGLMNFTGGTHGYALMSGSSDDNVHALVELVLHQKGTEEGRTLYVDEGSEVTRWTFRSAGGDLYTLSAADSKGTKYLAVSGDDLIVTGSSAEAAKFRVSADSSGRIQLSHEGKYVTFTMREEDGATVTGFSLSSVSSQNSLLALIDFTVLDDEDLITYSADRVSISDTPDGQKVIIYTRVWNDDAKRYDMYAVDHNGTLYPCYASGGKILWLGDGTGSLEWIFTEYTDPVTKESNYYYELYNPYSEKYIAPQLNSGAVLSGSTIGINMPGRRSGKFYSRILAWDENNYTFVGMKPNDDNTKLVPCAESVAADFYFATLEPLNISDRLHTVNTVDNKQYGITMKMKDFSGQNHGDKGAIEQNRYLVNENYNGSGASLYKGYDVTAGLLSNSLDENGYPVCTNTGKDLGGLYSGAQEVNHLFIQSIYNSSGYFEFDSCQNFATIKNSDNGDFTVYRELGTSKDEGKDTLKHGQFFPYNDISAGNYSTANPKNLFPSDTRVKADGSRAYDQLPESDPRKYESLYSAGTKTGANAIDYHFGMELGAEFVQTVNGLDAWGHDIIFEFTGDDDFWLYVDNELVIDLGGVHSALGGKVNFRTGEVIVNGTKTSLKELFIKNFTERYKAAHSGDMPSEAKISEFLQEHFEKDPSKTYGCEEIFSDYSVHNMKIFYMERGAGASNLHMRFNLASVIPGHVVVKKSVEGDGADQIDKEMVEYPFQIYYTDANGIETRLANDSEHISVRYQNSTQAVKFVKKYYPPGRDQSYDDIYYLNPAKDAEILFPDEAISYRIVECAVDPVVYRVSINGELKTSGDEGYSSDPTQPVYEISGLLNVSSDNVQVKDLPIISFENQVKKDVIRTLEFTKRVYDENNEEVLDDDTTFKFRLSLGTTYDPNRDLPLVDRAPYYVVDPDGYYCRYDAESSSFVPTEWTYRADDDSRTKTNLDSLTESQRGSITFRTSIYGAIDHIPSRYTVCVPNLPAGTVFKVEERYTEIPSGYGLDRYKHIEGHTESEYGEITKVNSYNLIDKNVENIGVVIPSQDPKMEVRNKKGYGINVRKKWSDISITTGHAPVYTAVYVDGELLEDSVKQIKSPDTSAYYFWPSLEPNADGSERTSLEGYVIKEVTISGTPEVAADGTVTGYGTVTPLETGDGLELSATRAKAATPAGESAEKEFEYIVSYERGTQYGSAREDVIKNTRSGGLALRLFRWNSTVPLSGGKFLLKDSSGKTVGEYTSDSEGSIAILYSFEHGQVYTLEQKTAPSGYVGLQEKLCFKLNNDETVSLFKEDGTTLWKTNGWADTKPGENGITAFVDVYNKPFNFKIVKTDSEDSSVKLGAAHFALYKQQNTTVSGYVKNKDPMTGFEDLVTVNGEVDICGGKSGRSISPGAEGSVYFLTETQAPFNYKKLDEDIIFRISPIGVPSMISDAYNGTLVETDEGYIYTLSVPNKKKDKEIELLTVTKKVTGSFGNKSKEFSFKLVVSGAEEDEEFVWAKNGEEQTPMSSTGGSFTLKHNDKVEISLPKNVTVTLAEEESAYETTIKVGSGEAQETSRVSFLFEGSESIVVTNRLSGIIATGTASNASGAVAAVLLPILPIGGAIWFRRRRKHE